MANKSIGEANVKLTVDGADDVASKLKGVKTETESLGGAMQDTVRQVDSGIRSFRRLAGIMTFAGGAVTSLIGLLGQLSKGMSDIQSRANDMGNAIATATDASQLSGMTEGLRQAARETGFIQRGLLQASGELERSGSLVDELSFAFGKFTNLLTGAADQQGQAFRAISRSVQDATESKRRQLRIAEDLTKQSELQAALENARIAELEGIERIEAEAARRSLQREKQIQEARKQGFQEQVDLLEQINNQELRNAERRIAAIRDEQRQRDASNRERERRDQERREEQARRETDRALRELARALEAQARQTNELNRSMEQLSRDVNNFTGDIMRVGDGIRR